MLVDPEQIRRAQRGDDNAFTEVMGAYRKRVLGTITRSIRHLGVAEEVFRGMHHSLKELRTWEVFEPWLYRLTVNATYDHL